MSPPQHPGDETGDTGYAEPARSRVMTVLGIVVVAILVGVVVLLHLTGMLSPGDMH